MKEINYNELINNLKKIRKGLPRLDTSKKYDYGYKVGYETAINFVFALLDSKENIIYGQGEHAEDYIAAVNGILKRQSK